jgi:hypothetical protein
VFLQLTSVERADHSELLLQNVPAGMSSQEPDSRTANGFDCSVINNEFKKFLFDFMKKRIKRVM